MYIIFLVFFIWRLVLFISASIGERFLLFTPRFPYSEILLQSTGLPQWIWSFANFDGVHYLTIAKSGYSAQFTQVFFPLYPFFIAIFYNIFPYLNHLIIGLISSNILFIASLIFFWKLLLLDFKKGTAIWILLFMVFYPTSYYFGSVYSESLFFLFIILSFLEARRKRWILTAFFGFLACATRLVGIFLVPALLVELYLQSKGEINREKIKKNIWPILAICFIPFGLIGYMIYLQVYFGDWLYFWHAQSVFGASRSSGSIILFPQVLWRYIKILTTLPITTYAFWISFLEISTTLISILLLVLAYRKKVRITYIIFSIFALLIPTLTGTFSSMPRYVLVAFPVYITLGLLHSNKQKLLILLIDGALLIVFTMLFTSGRWIG